jgi:hypothetical protein
MKEVSDVLMEGGEHYFVRRFTGLACSSFRQGYRESEDIRMVGSSGLRQGPWNFDYLN